MQILFAAILLKLKSNILEGIDVLDFEPPQEMDDLEYSDEPLDYSEDYIPTSNVISIDEVLQRRTSVRLNHNRVVTLRDLIRQLEFYEMLDELNKRFDYDKENTSLPDKVDMEKIYEFVAHVNGMIVAGDY